MELDKDYEESISQARLKIKSSMDKMIMLKKSVLEFEKKKILELKVRLKCG
ncbi:hypothetical protein G8E05_07555 [Clostridium botulinum]|uniref:hypothetical protein n=1 Tax=Clostridium botulinum TaxID=1491 RepID=UPI00035BA365|nr:hypothetical protein [Clostridium botulinum]EPS49576.1 hypothetical protein CFSAN002368_17310 [Clostridium botulinum A1 str. CFSAN002368]MBY6877212.1 hypothetical protein [Clostridium botulinum]UOJ20878.1 hypothetical protein G8E05_07555 [Clostridium botulinum]WGZ46267.1 hypothetical protein HEQ52_08385 [Clostridium botulinum]BDB01924.1 hypothetical protein CBOS2020_19980 [Clostridium botulinum]